MKSRLQLICLAAVPLAVLGRADACSCRRDSGAEEIQIRREFEEARAVFVAELVSVKQTRVPDAPNYITEEAEFVVSEVLKGDIAAGQKVRVRSELGPGPCGRSARNDPMWLEEFETPGEPGKPAVISKRWLIYGHGTEPYELSLCDRSMPLSHRGSSDLAYLRALLGKITAANKVRSESQ